MKNGRSGLKMSVLVFLILTGFLANAQSKTEEAVKLDTIFPKGQRVREGNFTGAAWVYQLIEPDSAFTIPVGNVTFEPGARTYWHSHPGGQALMATGGIGYYQEKGKPIQVLRKGDTVKCPPNVPYWHGASPKAGFSQIAITPNTLKGRVIWLQEVTDAEYNSLQNGQKP